MKQFDLLRNGVHTPNNNRQLLAGLSLLGFILALSMAAPWITAHDPEALEAPALTRHLPPSLQHVLGTDQFGRDIFARLLYGGRISLLIGIAVVFCGVVFGTAYGAVSGYVGGFWDQILMRLVDILLAFPIVFLAVALTALFGAGLKWLILILIVTSWMDVARLVRSEILSLKERPFILKARAAGLSPRRIIFRHLIPNTGMTVLAVAVLRVADVILIESALSFLGLGVQPPAASWGSILNDGKAAFPVAWWMTAFPGLAIMLTTTSFNLIGEGLRERGR
jgi:peptide/nickel transport system permease protein